MVSSALDKVQLIKGTPPCQPGKCLICGNCGDKDSEFLDTSLEIDFYGVVYFCTTCVYGDILKALSLVTQEKYDESQAQLTAALAQIVALQMEKEALKDAIKSMVGSFGSSDSVSDFDSKQSDVVASVEATEPVTDTNTKSVSRKTSAAKSRPVKQDDEPRSSSVSNNDALKESISKFKL